MRAIIRVSGDRKNGGPSTEAELQVLHDREWVVLTPDSTGGGVVSYSLRPAECRVLIAALTEAAALAEAVRGDRNA